jgi:hypothetical protein
MVFPQEVMEYVGVNVAMRGRKSKSALYWQGALKQKGVENVGVKQGICTVQILPYVNHI